METKRLVEIASTPLRKTSLQNGELLALAALIALISFAIGWAASPAGFCFWYVV